MPDYRAYRPTPTDPASPDVTEARLVAAATLPQQMPLDPSKPWQIANASLTPWVTYTPSGTPPPVQTGTVVAGVQGQSQNEYLLSNGGPYRQIAQPARRRSRDNVVVYLDATATGGSPGTQVKVAVTATTQAAGQVNPVIAAWSEFFDRVLPGKDFALADLSVPGTGRASLTDDAHPEARWPQYAAMVARVRQDYEDFDAIVESWMANDNATAKESNLNWAPLYMGERFGGQALALGATNPDWTGTTSPVFDHALWDVTAPVDAVGRGIFKRSRTKLYFVGWPTLGAVPTTTEALNSEGWTTGKQVDRPARQRIDEFAAHLRGSTFIGGVIGSMHIANLEGGVHPVTNHPDGQILLGWPLAVAILKVAGVAVTDPQIQSVTVAPDGAYADVRVSLPNGGNLTTLRILEGRAAPATPSPQQQQVVGFEIRRNGDADSARRPVMRTSETSYPAAYRGSVVIQNTGTGTGSSRYGIVRITPTTPFANGDLLEYLRGDASAMLLKARDNANQIYLDQLLETIPAWRDAQATYPFPGLAVKPQPPALTIAGVGAAVTASLTAPTDSASGSTGATGTVVTDTGSGTLHYGVWPFAAATPTAAQIEAGTGAVLSGSAAVSATGTRTVSLLSGLAASTTYRMHFVQKVGSAFSNVASGDGFTTSAGITPYFIANNTVFLDPVDPGTGVTNITFEGEFRLATFSTGGAKYFFAQESQGADLSFVSSDGVTASFRVNVEDGDGTTMISQTGTGLLSSVAVPKSTWFRTKFEVDWIANQAVLSLNGSVAATIPFVAAAAPAQAQPTRQISFLGWQSLLASSLLPADAEVGFLEASFTINGTRILRKRIAGDAATVNAEPVGTSGGWRNGTVL